MRVENLRSETTADKAKVAATVIWEDCDRRAQEITFETGGAFADDLTCNPDAFLLACVIPALRHGEQRIFMDAEICPELRSGIVTAMHWLKHWYNRYGHNHPLIRMEARVRQGALFPGKPSRAASFLSGGIDSLATLRANHLTYRPEHPAWIRDGILIGGLEVPGKEAFDRVVASLKEIAEDARITLIPIFTNVRSLDEDWGFWTYEFQGAAISSVAHVLAKRISLAYIASSDHIAELPSTPLGSHPFIDPNFTSSDVRIKHDGIELTRLMKTGLVAQWKVALKNIRVCTHSEKYTDGLLNCGECEKCLRTMLSLLALGVLNETDAFPAKDVSVDLLKARLKFEMDRVAYYRELPAPLASSGRHDLARAVEHQIASLHKPRWKKEWKDNPLWPLIQFDSRFFNGRIRRLKQSLQPQKHCRTAR